ncbi:hypothetical protein DIS24_g491 [Lasiodiplodia hormozganensis]|uniref:Uncharacterized protein n=1 Tax=Lasiodiplodia hormozganensis TaxID=869390 RepID=A0AA39Z6C9_9PEZI|nr:hypothetical protein DIS24_g491 [Lasiodiplodia hormozganensis]
MARRPVHISLKIAVPLSALMILFASIAFTGHRLDWPGKPAFTTFRHSEIDEHFLNNRLRALSSRPLPRFIYHTLHAGPAILWSLAMPFQHVDSLRARFPAMHRRNGYLVLSLSLLLSLGGFWILNRNMSHTHREFYHIHTVIKGKYIPLLTWPTFESSLWFLAPAYFYSLFRTAETARAREWVRHRKWAVFHTIAAYTITLQRVNVVVCMVAGWAMHLLVPERVQHEVLGVPATHEGKAAAELAAFAWTAWYGGILAFVWILYEWRPAALFARGRDAAGGEKSETIKVE